MTQRLVPGIAQLRVLRTYAGLRPWTADGLPLVGPTRQADGIVFATGHAGEVNVMRMWTLPSGSCTFDVDLLVPPTPTPVLPLFCVRKSGRKFGQPETTRQIFATPGTGSVFCVSGPLQAATSPNP